MPCVSLKMSEGAFLSCWPLFVVRAGEQGQMHGVLFSLRLKRVSGIPATNINTVQVTDWLVTLSGPSS